MKQQRYLFYTKINIYNYIVHNIILLHSVIINASENWVTVTITNVIYKAKLNSTSTFQIYF